MQPTDSTLPLWGLVQAVPLDPATGLRDQTFHIEQGGRGGVLTFASALDAEIYRQRLAMAGMHGWRRERLEHLDLARVMAPMPASERQLMLALGFIASDTRDLLMDEDQTLITPLLPIQFDMHHSLHDISQLRINADVLFFIREWWRRIGGTNYPEQVHSLERWSDLALARCAAEALGKARIIALTQYRQAWTSAGTNGEYALFVPESGAWQFVPFDGPRQCTLH